MLKKRRKNGSFMNGWFAMFSTTLSVEMFTTAGLASSATLFGLISQSFTFAFTPVVGEVALLVAAVVLLRLLPQGITGRFFKGGM